MTTKKVFQCCFCDKIMSSRQALFRHKSTTAKCIEIQNKGLIVKEAIQNPPTPLGLLASSSPLVLPLTSSPMVLPSDTTNILSDNLRLRKELAQTQEALVQYKELHDKHKKDEIERPTEPVSQYNLDIHEAELERFDENNYDHINGLHVWIHNKFTPDKFKLGQMGLTCVYSFFFPRFWRCTDKKRHVFKYINENGQLAVDDNLHALVKLICPIFCEVGAIVRDQLCEKEYSKERRDKYELIYLEDIAGESMPIFVEFMKRIVDLSDGTEKRKTLELAHTTLFSPH
jgi:hypothetical protein